MQNAGEMQHLHAYIKGHYKDNGKGHLNHWDFIPLLSNVRILLASPK
jgi:hypothetical protein